MVTTYFHYQRNKRVSGQDKIREMSEGVPKETKINNTYLHTYINPYSILHMLCAKKKKTNSGSETSPDFSFVLWITMVIGEGEK